MDGFKGFKLMEIYTMNLPECQLRVPHGFYGNFEGFLVQDKGPDYLLPYASL